MNKVILVGHLGRDPEARRTGSNLAICKLNLATNERRKDQNSGEWVEHTEWHRVTAFGRQAEFCEKHCKKGSFVHVEGSLRTDKWEKDGITRYSTEVIASTVNFFSGGSSGKSASAASPSMDSLRPADSLPKPSAPDEVSFDDDDIPF